MIGVGPSRLEPYGDRMLSAIVDDVASGISYRYDGLGPYAGVRTERCLGACTSKYRKQPSSIQ
eukprot:3941084-Rhodomonas_salina.3